MCLPQHGKCRWLPARRSVQSASTAGSQQPPCSKYLGNHHETPLPTGPARTGITCLRAGRPLRPEGRSRQSEDAQQLPARAGQEALRRPPADGRRP